MLLLNPKRYVAKGLDERSAALMKKVIGFFEGKGTRQLKHDDRERTWYADFLEFVKREQVFATLLTPSAHGGGDAHVRWDTFRNCEFNEITASYGLAYWYTWQVAILGLGPLWMAKNAAGVPGRAAGRRRRLPAALRRRAPADAAPARAAA